MVLEEPLFDISLSNAFLLGLLEEIEADSMEQKAPKAETTSKPKAKAILNPTKTTVHRAEYDHERLWNMKIEPRRLGLVPAEELADSEQMTLNDLAANHFRARSTRRLRFEHKLWNALTLVKHYPDLKEILGIEWYTPDIIRVDRNKFGSLLGLTRPTAALFNPQGSFQSHGFAEINMKPNIGEDLTVRYFRHKSGAFTKDSKSADLLNCRWQTKNIQTTPDSTGNN